ncbi:MAG: MotA/TolQ/ExbB proton channel family protein [Spirochaetes bacterium]|jgi:biopolymer transport protein ExbB|nr:MotA/TolQ/ExbB proton channel family protein [Spirochaetota bacterium]
MISLVEYGEIFVFLSLLFASILALSVGIERALVFRKNMSKESNKFLRELAGLLRKADMKGAREYLNNTDENIYSRFAEFSLTHYDDGQEKLTNLMSGKAIEERIDLEKRLPILSTLGNNAPFIGLLGTVLGVIKAFHGLGTLGNTGAEVVMRSISSALLATAAGLFVAIPVVMANNYFTKKVKIIIQHLEILSKEFIASYAYTASRKKSHRRGE